MLVILMYKKRINIMKKELWVETKGVSIAYFLQKTIKIKSIEILEKEHEFRWLCRSLI